MSGGFRAGLVGEIARRARGGVERCLDGDSVAVVLVSGGMDSAVLLRLLDIMGVGIVAVSINTRSRASGEKIALRRLLSTLENLRAFHEVETRDLMEAVELSGLGYGGFREREPYYIPARNIIFLGYALYYAEIHGARSIFTAHNKNDAQYLPDASRRFMDLFERLAEIYTPGVRICTPFSELDKVEVAILGIAIGAPIDLSWSCYDNKKKPCGNCRGCIEREHAIKKARVLVSGL
jgi:7-cyano-7-deazaguanine synthase